jgi:hypothetical protein
MILYDVKLICPKTKEILFQSLEKKPILPKAELYKREFKPLLVIQTVDSASINKKVA